MSVETFNQAIFEVVIFGITYLTLDSLFVPKTEKKIPRPKDSSLERSKNIISRLKDREEELSQCEEELSQCEEKLSQCEEKLSQCEEKLSQCKEALN